MSYLWEVPNMMSSLSLLYTPVCPRFNTINSSWTPASHSLFKWRLYTNWLVYLTVNQHINIWSLWPKLTITLGCKPSMHVIGTQATFEHYFWLRLILPNGTWGYTEFTKCLPLLLIGCNALVNYWHSWPLTPVKSERLVTWFDLSKVKVKIFVVAVYQFLRVLFISYEAVASS